MQSLEITVTHPVGLHARPAAEFVKLAAKFPCDIKICNMTAAGKTVNAKSILSVLTLGVQQGHVVQIETNGEREDEALQALRDLIQSNFGEGA
jgi:phosphotransferase system HPr (HPr) family protein